MLYLEWWEEVVECEESWGWLTPCRLNPPMFPRLCTAWYLLRAIRTETYLLLRKKWQDMTRRS